MKKIFSFILSLMFVSVIMVSCGPTTDDAVKYNDKLVEQQTKVFDKESALIEAISKNMPDKLDVLLSDLSKQVDSSTAAVNSMQGFDGKTELKDAALKVFSTYKEVTEKDYKDMIKFAKTPDSLYTQEDDNKLIESSKKIDDKLNKCIDDFVLLQTKFAEKYKFELNNTEKAMEKEKK